METQRLKAALNDLCINTSDIFTTKLNSQPALVRPMTIKTYLQACMLPKIYGQLVYRRSKESKIEIKLMSMFHRTN